MTQRRWHESKRPCAKHVLQTSLLRGRTMIGRGRPRQMMHRPQSVRELRCAAMAHPQMPAIYFTMLFEAAAACCHDLPLNQLRQLVC